MELEIGALVFIIMHLAECLADIAGVLRPAPFFTNVDFQVFPLLIYPLVVNQVAASSEICLFYALVNFSCSHPKCYTIHPYETILCI